MEVAIRSRNVRVPKTVRELTLEKVSRLERYLDGMDHAEVSFKEEKNPRIAEREICEVTVHGHGHVVRAKASSIDQMAAVDEVVDKLKHQLEKLKVKLVTRDHAHANNGHGKRIRKLVKSKSFVFGSMTAEDAAMQMEMVEHDFFLFTNSATGESALVYRRDDGEVGLIEASG